MLEHRTCQVAHPLVDTELEAKEICLRFPCTSPQGSLPISHAQSIRFCRFHVPERSQLEANVVCPEKLIPGLKNIVALKTTEKMKDLNKYFS
jgi:hypothetical protein